MHGLGRDLGPRTGVLQLHTQQKILASYGQTEEQGMLLGL